jgi:hypothetical protein
MSNPTSDVMDSCLSALATYLAGQISGLTILQEWPYANQQLTYPSLTISTKDPKRTPSMPILVSQTAPNESNQITANEAVAEWDDIFQMDLWTRSKAERKTITAQILDAFNAQEMDASGKNKSDGLSLQITDQYGEYARFEIENVQCVDDEASAQRQERREKITVIVNCREIRQRTYYAMTSIQLYGQVASNQDSDGFTDDTTDTEEKTIS